MILYAIDEFELKGGEHMSNVNPSQILIGSQVTQSESLKRANRYEFPEKVVRSSLNE